MSTIHILMCHLFEVTDSSLISRHYDIFLYRQTRLSLVAALRPVLGLCAYYFLPR
jgi:hypothetical protein